MLLETKLIVAFDDHEDIETIIDMAGYGIAYWADDAYDDGKNYVVVSGENKWTIPYEDILKACIKYMKKYNVCLFDDECMFDAGLVDSVMADEIIQFAIFGKIVFG